MRRFLRKKIKKNSVCRLRQTSFVRAVPLSTSEENCEAIWGSEVERTQSLWWNSPHTKPIFRWFYRFL